MACGEEESLVLDELNVCVGMFVDCEIAAVKIQSMSLILILEIK